MSDNGLNQLMQIARMIRDRDLAVLAARQGERQNAKRAREEFSGQAKAEDAKTSDHLGYRKDYELPRRVWRERRIYTLSHYEARAAAQTELQKHVTSKSFGRAMVLEGLVRKMREEDKRRADP